MPTLVLAFAAALAGACGQDEQDRTASTPAASETASETPEGPAPRSQPANDYDDPPIVLPELGAPEESLGYVDAGDIRIKVSQVGGLRPGDVPDDVREHFAEGRATLGFVTARISIDMTDGAVRGWIGDDQATGTVRTELYRTDQGWYSGQVLGPAPLPDDAQCWIECETADGERRQFFFSLPR